MLFVFKGRKHANLLFPFTLYTNAKFPSPGVSPGGRPPPKTRKFATDGVLPTPQPAMRIDNKRKFKFSLNFSKFLLKFLKFF